MTLRAQQIAGRGTDKTRAAIEQSALTLFAERGFHGTSVPCIARRAGIAAGTMYRHFPSKEQLVNELYRNAKLRFMAAFAGDFPVQQSPRSQFRWFFLRISAFARDIYRTRVSRAASPW